VATDNWHLTPNHRLRTTAEGTCYGENKGELRSGAKDTADYDSPWKDVLEEFFQPGVELCFPAIARQILWRRGVEFLDKEFQKILPAAAVGRRTVDKLAKVWRRDGQSEWVLVHVEVQAQRKADFAKRFFERHCRIRERFDRDGVSVAILADSDEHWHPRAYLRELWGCRLSFEFPTVKLLELAKDEQRLLACDNPFGVVVMAHVNALRTRKAWAQRRQLKWELVRGLYERKYARRTIQNLFRFIDWVMALPEDLAARFDEELVEYEKAKRMPYVTHIERKGRAEGRAEGRTEGRRQTLREATLEVLEARFGAVPYELREHIQHLTDEAVLKKLPRQAALARSIEDFQRKL
jgi:hypothetical protein